MKRVLFYGNFGGKEATVTNGQTSKILNFLKIFASRFPLTEVSKFNTNGFKRNPVMNFFRLKKCVRKCDIIVIFPGSLNSLKIVLSVVKNSKTKVFYPIVGGWLCDKIKNDKKAIKLLRKVEYFYPETKGLDNQLKTLGFNNSVVIPVFTTREVLPLNLIMQKYESMPHDEIRFVYFGRVSKYKGVYLAIDAIKKLNENYGIKCKLDIYGSIQEKENLSDIVANSYDNVRYLGILPDSNVSVIGEYDMFLFPTFYSGEGFPACCVESFCFGTPIVASNWKYNKEIIDVNYNGFLFDLDENNLSDVIYKIIKNYDIIELKKNAYETGKKFLPDIVLRPFLEKMKEVLNYDK